MARTPLAGGYGAPAQPLARWSGRFATVRGRPPIDRQRLATRIFPRTFKYRTKYFPGVYRHGTQLSSSQEVQEMNDFYLERMVRMRQAELRAEADRERVARRLTTRHLPFVWVRYAVSALERRLAGLPAAKVARERIDL